MSEARELLERFKTEAHEVQTYFSDVGKSDSAYIFGGIVEALRRALATQPEPGAVPELPEYVIWSNEHAAWWRAGCRGYATDLAEAGRYSREEALSICDQWVHFSVPREIPILFDDARILTTCERARRAES